MITGSVRFRPFNPAVLLETALGGSELYYWHTDDLNTPSLLSTLFGVTQARSFTLPNTGRLESGFSQVRPQSSGTRRDRAREAGALGAP
jgi:hypothetical protein